MRHQTTGKRHSLSEPDVAVERRPRHPQRLADVVNFQALVGMQLLGKHDLGVVRTDLRPSTVAGHSRIAAVLVIAESYFPLLEHSSP